MGLYNTIGELNGYSMFTDLQTWRVCMILYWLGDSQEIDSLRYVLPARGQEFDPL